MTTSKDINSTEFPRWEKIKDQIECECTNPVHGGKIWKCNTEECPKYKHLYMTSTD